jgi:hypothetical protein
VRRPTGQRTITSVTLVEVLTARRVMGDYDAWDAQVT